MRFCERGYPTEREGRPAERTAVVPSPTALAQDAARSRAPDADGIRSAAGGRGGAAAAAFTLIELLCVMALIGILAALLLPSLSKVRQRALRVQCVSQLRQTGLAFHSFAHDHGSQFPMRVPAASGGALELAQGSYRVAGEFYLSFRYFQALSNDLAHPRVFACPSDTRVAAPNFAVFGNSNLSYFVAVNADYGKPNSVLAGDRNVTNDGNPSASLQSFAPGRFLKWTAGLHQYQGDLLFADGRVEEKNRPVLVSANNQGLAAATLALPADPSRNPSRAGSVPSLEAFTGSGIGNSARGPTATVNDPVPAPPVLTGQARPANPPPSSLAGSSTALVPPTALDAASAATPPPAKKPALTNAPIRPLIGGANSASSEADDANWSPLAQWLAGVMDDVVRKGLWLLYFVFGALVVLALELRRRLLAKKKRPGKARP